MVHTSMFIGLEDEELFRSANILQIADVVRRAVVLLCYRF